MSREAPEVRIRRAKQSDVAAVMMCLAEAFEPYRESYTPDGFQDSTLTVKDAESRIRETTVLVAEDNSGRVIGTIALQLRDRHAGHLRGMAVVPEFQGQGVAERLLSDTEKQSRKFGCSRLSLDTTQPLKRATRFYLRHGYKASGIVKDFFGMPLFEYVKTLDGEDA